MQLFFHLPWRQQLTSQLLHLHATDHTKAIKYSNFRTCLLFLTCLKNPRCKKLQHCIHKCQPLDSYQQIKYRAYSLKPYFIVIQSTIMPPKCSSGSRNERRQQRRAVSAQCSGMFANDQYRQQQDPRLLAAYYVQLKNRKSEGCKKYKLCLNLHCNFPIFFIFEKFVKVTCVKIHDLIIFFRPNLSRLQNQLLLYEATNGDTHDSSKIALARRLNSVPDSHVSIICINTRCEQIIYAPIF